jgi:hypothetical protein
MSWPTPGVGWCAPSWTTEGQRTAVAANSAQLAAAALRTRRGGSAGSAGRRACPRGSSGRSAMCGPWPSRRSRAATDTMSPGARGGGTGMAAPEYRASSSATVTVPVLRELGSCKPAGGSTGRAFPVAFEQVLSGSGLVSYSGALRPARRLSPARLASPEQPWRRSERRWATRNAHPPTRRQAHTADRLHQSVRTAYIWLSSRKATKQLQGATE